MLTPTTIHLNSEQDAVRQKMLAELLIDPQTGLFRAVPYKELQAYDQRDLQLFGHLNGIYQFPTHELTDYLIEHIGGRTAIEVGSGNGVIGRELNIPRTDSHLQERPDIKLYYEMLKQPVLKYGPDVERLECSEAIRKYKPQVVIGCWVTQKLPKELLVAGGIGGNVDGLDEAFILFGNTCVEEYIVVGNEKVHGDKLILSNPKVKVTIEHPLWLVSRASNPAYNCIYHFTLR